VVEKIAKYSISDIQFDNFSGKLCQPGVLNKDQTVWLDGVKLANTCIPPSFLGNAPALPSPKNTFTSIKN
jgi:hypothetical protein